MADYMFLYRGGAMPTAPAEMQAYMQKWVGWMEELRNKGEVKGTGPLESKVGKVVSGKKKVVTDGPFAEAKDLVGGYTIIAARDLDHATELSMGCPIFEREGSVEVRALMAMQATQR